MQLGKPVKIWTGLMRPFGITTNSKGEILVALRDGTTDIVKYDAEGRRVNLIEKSGLIHPRSIACDDEDNIYCIDQSRNSKGRSALAITDQKLFMAEYQALGVIKVYNKQLRQLATIKHRNMHVKDISVDIHQNLYVSDRKNSCVHVFTKDGVHLHSFSHDKKELEKPRGVCVRGQYVYVTDATSHCVCAFTTDGEYVTSYGQKGQEEGDFNVPCYISVDSDGFIYVTDFFNDRIQCF